jgi:hypothetical protein
VEELPCVEGRAIAGVAFGGGKDEWPVLPVAVVAIVVDEQGAVVGFDGIGELFVWAFGCEASACAFGVGFLVKGEGIDVKPE